MSGIFGLYHRDGEPVNHDVLVRMTGALAYRGPDGQSDWSDGGIGFGHTMLRTTWESQHEQQPLTLDGRSWLVADARVDGRAELALKLDIKGAALEKTSDAELIFRAYQRWGESCVEHLIGDFAFAIWNSQEGKFFCARDQMGLKPFYYAELGSTFIFSNDLKCLRSYPGVPSDLNDEALVHFILFGHNRNLSTTTFSAIRRLPPAHTLSINAKTVSVRRYWKLEVDSCPQSKRSSDYVERFRELFTLAVQDRMRADQIGLTLSGGMDSTTVAAFAKRSSMNQGRATQFRAFTLFEDVLHRDPERRYAAVAAKYLDIAFEPIDISGVQAFDRFDDPQWYPPEPEENAFLAIADLLGASISRHSRVVLDGSGSDALFANSPRELGDWPVAEIAKITALFLIRYGRVPKIGFRTALRRMLRPCALAPVSASESILPAWFRPEMARHLHREQANDAIEDIESLDRKTAYGLLMNPAWVCGFEAECAGLAKYHIESRAPFFDLRLLAFTLSIPEIPWCIEKHLLRRVTSGLLPRAIRRRPKTLLRHDLIESRQTQVTRVVAGFRPSEFLERFVDWTLITELLNENSILDAALRSMCLDYWKNTQVTYVRQ